MCASLRAAEVHSSQCELWCQCRVLAGGPAENRSPLSHQGCNRLEHSARPAWTHTHTLLSKAPSLRLNSCMWFVTFLIIANTVYVLAGHVAPSHVAQCSPLTACSSARVRSINTEVGAVHVQAGITREERNSAHQILRASHLTHGDKGSPLLLQLWVIVEDLLGTVTC
jgi:hypothetical protein